ncbi:MAG: ABC transporter ATP-binding protein [Acetobacteraceae bacterium]
MLSVDDLSTTYQHGGRTIRAVDGVSLSLAAGETLGLVGESGCGKSTLGKAVLRLLPSAGGQVRFDGTDITRLTGRALQPFRRRMQMVFQDPASALNPRQTTGTLLAVPLMVHGIRSRTERRRRVEAMMDRVGLPRSALTRYPHEFSGGQKQRIGIARALVLQPELLICDEPVSALDVSIQAQILNLLVDIKQQERLSYLFISHDLGVVRYIADRVAVMYLGRIVETAPQESLWNRPAHPYTRALIDAVPGKGHGRPAPIAGDLPDPADVPQGCRFHQRCPMATAICRTTPPAWREVAPGHHAACHHAA